MLASKPTTQHTFKRHTHLSREEKKIVNVGNSCMVGNFEQGPQHESMSSSSHLPL